MRFTIAAKCLVRVAATLEKEQDYTNSDLVMRMASALLREHREPEITDSDISRVYEQSQRPASLEQAAERVMENGGFRQNSGYGDGMSPHQYLTPEQMQAQIATDPRVPKDHRGKMYNEGLKVNGKFLSLQRLRELMKTHQHEDDGAAGHGAPVVAK